MEIIDSKLYMAFKIAKGILICKAALDTKLSQERNNITNIQKNAWYRSVDKSA